MKHRISGKKLGRDTKQRKALFRSLAASFVHHGHIITSLRKAKVIQPIIEKLVTKAKKHPKTGYALIQSALLDVVAAGKLIRIVAPSFTRSSGFTRIERIGFQKGDASPTVKLEWTK